MLERGQRPAAVDEACSRSCSRRSQNQKRDREGRDLEPEPAVTIEDGHETASADRLRWVRSGGGCASCLREGEHQARTQPDARPKPVGPTQTVNHTPRRPDPSTGPAGSARTVRRRTSSGARRTALIFQNAADQHNANRVPMWSSHRRCSSGRKRGEHAVKTKKQQVQPSTGLDWVHVGKNLRHRPSWTHREKTTATAHQHDRMTDESRP